MHTFHIQAYYEDGSVYRATKIMAPDANTAFARVIQFTWAQFRGGLNPDMAMAIDGGEFLPVAQWLAIIEDEKVRAAA